MIWLGPNAVYEWHPRPAFLSNFPWWTIIMIIARRVRSLKSSYTDFSILFSYMESIVFRKLYLSLNTHRYPFAFRSPFNEIKYSPSLFFIVLLWYSNVVCFWSRADFPFHVVAFIRRKAEMVTFSQNGEIAQNHNRKPPGKVNTCHLFSWQNKSSLFQEGLNPALLWAPFLVWLRAF